MQLGSASASDQACTQLTLTNIVTFICVAHELPTPNGIFGQKSQILPLSFVFASYSMFCFNYALIDTSKMSFCTCTNEKRRDGGECCILTILELLITIPSRFI